MRGSTSLTDLDKIRNSEPLADFVRQPPDVSLFFKSVIPRIFTSKLFDGFPISRLQIGPNWF